MNNPILNLLVKNTVAVISKFMGLSYFSGIILIIFLSSCVTPGSFVSSKKEQRPLIPKEGQDEIPASQSPKPLVDNVKFHSEFERLTKPNVPLTPEDLDFRNQLNAQESPTAEEEALLYLFNVHLILNTQANESFEESVIDTSLLEEDQDSKNKPASQPNTKVSFSSLSEDEGFAFDKVLKENTFLNVDQNVAILTAMALRKENNLSHTMSFNLYTYLKGKLSEWPDLPLPEDPSAVVATPPGDQNNDSPEAEQGHTNTGMNEQSPSSAQGAVPDANLSPEDILRIAQDLADQGQYREALNHTRLIAENSPAYADAQAKAHSFMNLGVEELRAKAAGAFESAVNNENSQVKKSYLLKAREYLLSAKNDYPEADEISSVNDNLEVIERELVKLP